MKIRLSIQKIMAFTIAYMVSFLALLNCVNALTNALGLNTPLDTVIMYAFLWALAIFTWVCAMRKSYFKGDVFLFAWIFVILFFVAYFLYPKNAEYVALSGSPVLDNPIIVFFMYSLTGYVAVRALHNYDDLLRYLYVFSYVVIILSALVFFFVRDSFAGQYMTLSYNMLLQTCFLFAFPPKIKSWLHYLIVALGVFIITFGGARGALMGLLVAILIKLIASGMKLTATKGIAVTVTFILTAVTVMLFYEQILLTVIYLLESVGISSRNLKLLLSTSGDISSGRFGVYYDILNNISWFGYGLYGDRVILDGIYAHNLFLEWIAEFGIVGGLILSVAFVFLLCVAFKKCDRLSRLLLIVFIPNGLIGLLFSGSYLGQQPSFYILLGLCVNIVMCAKESVDTVQPYGSDK